MLTLVRRMAIVLWLVAVISGVGFYLVRRERFSPESIAGLLMQYSQALLLAYLVVSVLRALVLIPSTPFVLAGSLLIPDRPLTVLGISMLGIALAATLIYYLSDALGFRALFETKQAPVLRRLEKLLHGRQGYLVLTAWSFFPLVPTDAACYVAGTVRMPFWRYLSAVCLGELVICTCYTCLGHGLWQWLL